jgi:hypothetical protein
MVAYWQLPTPWHYVARCRSCRVVNRTCKVLATELVVLAILFARVGTLNALVGGDRSHSTRHTTYAASARLINDCYFAREKRGFQSQKSSRSGSCGFGCWQ